MISVITPTYKEPEVLDVCLKSAIKGQASNNQIIVVVDGFYEVNKEVLDKYKDSIEILVWEELVRSHARIDQIIDEMSPVPLTHKPDETQK